MLLLGIHGTSGGNKTAPRRVCGDVSRDSYDSVNPLATVLGPTLESRKHRDINCERAGCVEGLWFRIISAGVTSAYAGNSD